ncbi:MAG: 3-oxoadipate enol-lactonase [Acetobacteraceae bacterium]|nr:3-oxoadipate enol-lactonase [Acetobacteraceae bacterium]MBV8524463.1 3-oxoadipate enol-lactonase [Acetobacteraceae bacterium]
MFVRTRDLSAHVQIAGPGGAPPLVLLHSLGTNLHVWDPQAEALAFSFRVIRPDLRGHGLTTVTPGPYSIEGMARDVLHILDAIGVIQAHVAGLSIGGLVAQSIAAQAPGRVASLILCDTAMAIPPAELWQERCVTVRSKGTEALAEGVMARWVTPGFMHTPEAEGLRAMLLRTDPEGYAGAAEAIAAADLTQSTSGLNVPALILVGEQDEATPLASAQALQAAIAGSSLEVIPAASHIPTIEKPAEVTDAIGRFLAPVAADSYEAGMAVRKQVLGDAHVQRATASVTDFDRDFQAFITRTAWGSIWTRPQLDRRTRSLLTLAMMAALGHHEEFKLHIRASRNTGATPADIADMLLQVAVYAGIPAANSAVRIAKETFGEMEQ